MTEKEIYDIRHANNILPVYKMVDTCASEFESNTPYFYGTYETENESIRSDKKKVVVLGSGPIRIGQGVEFDYATVHAVWAIREAVMKQLSLTITPKQCQQISLFQINYTLNL